jgi:hypothetical protein
MPTTSTRDLVRRYQDALNASDFDALDDIIAPDIATPDLLPGFGQGLEGVKAIARAGDIQDHTRTQGLGPVGAQPRTRGPTFTSRSTTWSPKMTRRSRASP